MTPYRIDNERGGGGGKVDGGRRRERDYWSRLGYWEREGEEMKSDGGTSEMDANMKW